MTERKPAHLIELQPWNDASVGVRIACETISLMLWPLSPDDRMTALISVLANHIGEVAETNDQIDAIVDVVRMQLKMMQPLESPPLQAGYHGAPEDRHQL